MVGVHSAVRAHIQAIYVNQEDKGPVIIIHIWGTLQCRGPKAERRLFSLHV